METETVKTYSITKEHCQSMINGVCNGCGGELEPIETVDNAGRPTYWAGCLKCGKYHWGTSREIFEIAVDLVDNNHYVHYRHMYNPNHKPSSTDEQKAYWRTSNIAGTCGLVSDVFNSQKRIQKSNLLTK